MVVRVGPCGGRPRSPAGHQWDAGRRSDLRARLPAGRSRGRARAARGAGLVTATITEPWGIWAALSVAGAAGLWSEETRLGKELSGPLVSTLAGLLMSNCGVIPSDAPSVYGVVNKFLLPLAVPLLLFSADLRRMLQETGKLLLAFSIGAVATVLATLLAFKLLPLRSLGADSWKVAAALAARHIGGAVNYVGVSESLQISASAQAAGLAADNLLCALYFTTLFQLARDIPPDPPTPASGKGDEPQGSNAAPQQGRLAIQVTEGATAVGLAALLCFLGKLIARALNVPGALIPIATALTVGVATAMPQAVVGLVPSGEGIAAILMQIFFATVGANGSVRAVVATAPALFSFSFLQIAIHLVLILTVGSALRFSKRDLLLASNANVGGPTTAAGMAAAKGWRSSLVPALLVGTLGYAIATFLAVALGVGVLQKM